MHSEQELRWFDRHNKRRPESISHGVGPDDIANRMRQLKPHSWKLRGNQLIGMTDMGPLAQTIPTDRILVGTDEHGLPKFRRITVQN